MQPPPHRPHWTQQPAFWIIGVLASVATLVVAGIGLVTWAGTGGSDDSTEPGAPATTEAASPQTSTAPVSTDTSTDTSTAAPPAAADETFTPGFVSGVWTDSLGGGTWSIFERDGAVEVEAFFEGLGSMSGTGTFRDGRLAADLMAPLTGAVAELRLTQTSLDVLEGTLTDVEFAESVDIRLDR